MNVLVIAPHADDETLGCGGTLLKHKNNNDQIFWLTITSPDNLSNWNDELINSRKTEISLVKNQYGFKQSFHLNLPAAELDTIPISNLISKISLVTNKVKPSILYIPFSSDVHTDHQIVVKAIGSQIKWFRHDYVKKVLMYETISETDLSFTSHNIFSPNFYFNISDHLEKKIDIMKIYNSEFGKFPFPRSEEAIKAQAILRGSQCGFNYAEAFKLIFEKIT